MHREALEAVAGMIRTSEWSPSATRWQDYPKALDLGGADVNGTARNLFPGHFEWYGLDIAPGPGVDIVADACDWGGLVASDTGSVFGTVQLFDVILCTELLEHVKDWQLVLSTIWRNLATDGTAFVTCASTGRRPHGARGELDPPFGEYYDNVSAADFLVATKADPWVAGQVTYNPNPGDLYAWMRK